MHGFAFAPDTQGYVLSVPTRSLAQTALDFGGLDRLRRPLALDTQVLADTSDLAALFGALEAEYRRDDAHRAAALLALRRACRARLHAPRRRAKGGGGAGCAGSATSSKPSFSARGRCRSMPASSASRRRISAAPAARRSAGRRSPSLHDRVTVEAQRKLAYTPANVGRIAEDLGFVDASNFTKFFKARTGATPRAFRTRLGG